MNRFQQDAILITLIDKLREKNSWCGRTHIQEAAYFLETFFNVPLNAEFILHKRRPFSFDLDEHLDILEVNSFVKSVPQPYPFGFRYLSTDLGKKIVEKAPKTLDKFAKEINFVADNFGPKNVLELVRLATTLYLSEKSKLTEDEIVKRIQEIEPGINEKTAREGLKEIKEITEKANNGFALAAR